MMEQGLNSASNTPPGSVDKFRVYDVRPLKCIVPIFSNAPDMSSISTTIPLVQPVYPFLVSNDSYHTTKGAATVNSRTLSSGFDSAAPASVPLNPFRTPLANGETSQPITNVATAVDSRTQSSGFDSAAQASFLLNPFRTTQANAKTSQPNSNDATAVNSRTSISSLDTAGPASVPLNPFRTPLANGKTSQPITNVATAVDSRTLSSGFGSAAPASVSLFPFRTTQANGKTSQPIKNYANAVKSRTSISGLDTAGPASVPLFPFRTPLANGETSQPITNVAIAVNSRTSISGLDHSVPTSVPLNPFRTPLANGKTSLPTTHVATAVNSRTPGSCFDSAAPASVPLILTRTPLENEKTRQSTTNVATAVTSRTSYSGFDNVAPASVRLNPFRPPQANGKTSQPTTNVATAVNSRTANSYIDSAEPNGKTSRPKRASVTRGSASVILDNDGRNRSEHVNVDDGSNSVKSRGRPKKRKSGGSEDIDVESIVDSFLTLFKLNKLDDFRRSSGDKDTTGAILMVYDLIRRKLTQLEEACDGKSGIGQRPDLKTCSLLMAKKVRTNNTKRIGHVPGIDVGDIFFYRMELCLVGLHAPSMAGIDYMTVDEEPLAVSIVSSGGYDDNDDDDHNVLIYTGHGGVARRDGQMFDQKLERGNLALEKSLHRGNDVRVIRGIRDPFGSASKIYVYDGVYKIQESWAEKNKSGCNVFKYKMVRQPGQPEAFSIWKLIQEWRSGNATRKGLIIPDLTSGSETYPVSLVNDVDREKGPSNFTYLRSLKYSQPFQSSRPFSGCRCEGGCQPGDTSCPCGLRNHGLLPYSSLRVLVNTNPVIYECGKTCSCPSNCRNRTTQTGTRVRLEVFKTKNRGWGLRSWDPIRAGSFICEYAGDFESLNIDDDYIFDASRHYKPLEPVRDSADDRKAPPFPLVISSKSNGNVARFMNHSCSPNVFWQPILRESDNDAFLHVGFFATRHVPPLQELVYDYGIPEEADRAKKKKCLCGSANCRGYFY